MIFSCLSVCISVKWINDPLKVNTKDFKRTVPYSNAVVYINFEKTTHVISLKALTCPKLTVKIQEQRKVRCSSVNFCQLQVSTCHQDIKSII